MKQLDNKKIIDFSEEISEHILWNIRLRCFLDGGECIPEEQVISSHECTLGKWLYTEGMNTYGMIPEMQELEKVHAELHTIVKQVIKMKDSGDIYAAKLELAKLMLISSNIVTLILAVEKKTEIVKERDT